MAHDDLQQFAAVATHLSSPTSATKSARSRLDGYPTTSSARAKIAAAGAETKRCR